MFVFIYLNNILICFKSPDADIAHVRRVLTILNDASVSLSLKMWKFFTETNDYLHHLNRSRRQKITSITTNTMRGLRPPTNLTELRSLLGMCNVPIHFDAKFACVVAHLERNFRNDQPSTFKNLSEKDLNYFIILKVELLKHPIVALPLPNPTEHRAFDTDTFDVQVQCVLHQQQPNETIWLFYYSPRSLIDVELKYDKV